MTWLSQALLGLAVPGLVAPAALLNLSVPLCPCGEIRAGAGANRAAKLGGLAPISALLCSVALGIDSFSPLRALGVLMVGAGVTFGVSAKP